MHLPSKGVTFFNINMWITFVYNNLTYCRWEQFNVIQLSAHRWHVLILLFQLVNVAQGVLVLVLQMGKWWKMGQYFLLSPTPVPSVHALYVQLLTDIFKPITTIVVIQFGSVSCVQQLCSKTCSNPLPGNACCQDCSGCLYMVLYG